MTRAGRTSMSKSRKNNYNRTAGKLQKTLIDCDEYRIVGKLEDFCCSPEFTTFIAEFQQKHADKFTDSEEQSLE